MVIEMVDINKRGSTAKPYDFEINPNSGALRDLCKNCVTFLPDKDLWLKKSLMEAMRISLVKYGKVRIIHCGECGKAHCAVALKEWLKKEGPHVTDPSLIGVG